MPRATFTLALLGTDTKFYPTLKETKSQKSLVSDFPKGELLSVIASHIKTSPQSPVEKLHEDIAYATAEVAVLNGPSAVGTNIKTIIGHGLALTLNAIADGRCVQIIGHSRGAVESILVAHEVQAIQKIIQKNQDIGFDDIFNVLEAQGKRRNRRLFSVLYRTGCIIKPLKELLPQSQEEQQGWLLNLKKHITSSTLNLFNIDPVPGEVPFYWWDERFFIIPKIVKKSITLLCSHERSYGFAVLHAKPECPSDLHQKIIIPAHHGSISSGNNASQQKQRYAGKTTHPHKFAVFNLLEFLLENGVEFENSERFFEKGAAMGRTFLSPSDDPRNLNTLDFDEIKRKIYDQMRMHAKDYEAIKESNYAYVYRDTARYVLADKIYYKFEHVFPSVPGYINLEHQQLTKKYFSKLCGKLHLSESEDLSTFLTQFTEAIATKLSDKSLSAENSADFIEVIKICFAEASQKYLIHIGDDAEKLKQKKLLYKQIRTALLQISTLSHPITTLIKSEGVNIIERTLEEQTHKLKLDLEALIVPIETKLKYFFNHIIIQINASEKKELNTDISDILGLNEFKVLRNQSLTDKIQFICEQLSQRTTKQPLELLLTAWEKSQSHSSLSELERASTDSMPNLHALIRASSQNLAGTPSSQYSLDDFASGASKDSLEAASPTSATTAHALPTSPGNQEEMQFVRIKSQRFTEQSQIAYLSKLFELQYPLQYLDDFKTLFAKINTLILDIRSIRYLFLEYSTDVSALAAFELRLHDQKEVLTKTVVKTFSPTSSATIHEFSDSFEKHCERQEVAYVQEINDKKQLHAYYQKIIEEQKTIQLSQASSGAQERQALTEEEARCFLLIKGKIKPLTQQYHDYLSKLLENMPEAKQDITQRKKALIQQKKDIVDKLLKCLEEDKKHYIPAQQRLKNFFQKLNEAHESLHKPNCDILKQHRDSHWARFRYTIYKAVGLLIGLFTLVPLWIYTKRGNSFSFWNSKGAEFVNNVKTFQPNTFEMTPK